MAASPAASGARRAREIRRVEERLLRLTDDAIDGAVANLPTAAQLGRDHLQKGRALVRQQRASETHDRDGWRLAVRRRNDGAGSKCKPQDTIMDAVGDDAVEKVSLAFGFRRAR